MKKSILITFILVCIIPSLLLGIFHISDGTKNNLSIDDLGLEVTTEPSNQEAEIKQENNISISVLKNNKTVEMPLEEYVVSVVLAEMPADFDIEALKAQAVAAHTFALHRKATNSDKEYDITDDFALDQAFITESDAREKWGENADEYIKKIKTAVSDTQNLALTYNGEIALAAYHAISFGKTEDCKNVWGGSRPYLTSVISIGDKLSPNFISTKTVSVAEFKALFPTLNLTDNPKDYFKDIQKTDAGTVKTLTVCGNQISGSEIRKALDLRSACFNVSQKDNTFTFTVYGYGHGVGMSQNGANYMAQQGADYKEILYHYYKGCKIEEIK